MRTPEMEKLWEERRERIFAAVRGEKPKDRMPVIMQGYIPTAKMMDPELVPYDIMVRPRYFLEKAFEGYEELKDIDALNALSGYSKASGLAMMTTAKLPGIDLPKTEIYQIDEKARMNFEDYQLILDEGWNKFRIDYIHDRVGLTDEDLAAGRPWMGMVTEFQEKYGYPQFSSVPHPSGWDALSGMRGMNHLFRDLRKDKQLIKDVLARMCADEWDNYLAMLKRNYENKGSIACMVQPAVRANCDFVSRAMYEEIIWPYAQKFTYAVIESGHVVHFHYDSRWDDFLDLYADFPAHKCIFDSDGLTDINLVKKWLGGKMAITGNNPPALMVLGNPDEVYDFTVKQMNEIGPEGYIITTSCTCPANAKPENLKAMIAAARA